MLEKTFTGIFSELCSDVPVVSPTSHRVGVTAAQRKTSFPGLPLVNKKKAINEIYGARLISVEEPWLCSVTRRSALLLPLSHLCGGGQG